MVFLSVSAVADTLLEARTEHVAHVVRTHAAQAEAERTQPRELLRAVRETGLTRLLLPRPAGGDDSSFQVAAAVIDSVAQVDASAGWHLASHLMHSWLLRYFPEAAQQEVWGADPDAFVATSFVPPAGNQQRTEGGYLLSGTWSWLSGVDHAAWSMVCITVPGPDHPTRLYCLVPASDYTIQDDWDVIAMRGTGSKQVILEEVFVPDEHIVAEEALHQPMHPDPRVRVHFLGASPLFYAACVLGATQGAYETWISRLRTATTAIGKVAVADKPEVHQRIGAIHTRLRAVRLVFQSAVRQAALLDGDMPATESLRSLFAHLASTCGQISEEILLASGAGAMRRHHPQQQYWRDIHAMILHPALAPHVPLEHLGRAAVMDGAPPLTLFG